MYILFNSDWIVLGKDQALFKMEQAARMLWHDCIIDEGEKISKIYDKNERRVGTIQFVD